MSKTTEETNKTNETPQEAQQPVPLAEALIGMALKLGQEQNLTLGELIGHMECAKYDVYNRITSNIKRSQAEKASSGDEPSEDVDTVEPEVVS